MQFEAKAPAAGADKVLTVSIAAYNVHDFLPKALDSCLVENAELLEVIVVDDGSQDDTAEIAGRYVSEYPHVFKLVQKKNGGYGTTVNASLAVARGKYYRLLDGDDWFDKAGLQQLIDDLKTIDCDLAINPFVEVRGDITTIVDQASAEVKGLQTFTSDIVPKELNMHAATFRTSVLRESGMILPGRRLYTDNLFVVTPLPFVATVFVSHVPVYQYRLDREGQSVSLESEMKHRADKMDLIKDLVRLYDGMEDGTAARKITGYWLSANTGFLLWLLHRLPPSQERNQEIRSLIGLLKESPAVWATSRRQSKWFRLLSGMTGKIYPLSHLLATHTNR